MLNPQELTPEIWLKGYSEISRKSALATYLDRILI